MISIGTKVKFIHTHDLGVVTGLLDNGMVTVRLLEDDMVIPAFEEDLVRVEDIGEKERVKAKFVPGKKEKEIAPPKRPDAEMQYAILKSQGIQLAFDPVKNKEGLAEKYTIYLINATHQDVIFTLGLSLHGALQFRKHGKLAATSLELVGDLAFDDLNDAPEVSVECRRIRTDGTGPPLFRNLKIKPKQFFKNIATAPLLNRSAHLYKLFETLEPPAKDPAEDLRAYTKRRALPGAGTARKTGFSYVEDFASFIPEIDLHIEKLVADPKKMSNSEILAIQLSYFEEYLNRAIRLGVKRVFLIHGVGKGRLRDAIATLLIQMPEVKSFKNEYHPRYGHGATEVELE